MAPIPERVTSLKLIPLHSISSPAEKRPIVTGRKPTLISLSSFGASVPEHFVII
jgi:hypothetical protein